MKVCYKCNSGGDNGVYRDSLWMCGDCVNTELDKLIEEEKPEETKCTVCGVDMCGDVFEGHADKCEKCFDKSRSDMAWHDNLTEKGDDIEPLVCSVCGSTEAGAGELNAGVFTCWECMKKRDFNNMPKLEKMLTMQFNFNMKLGHSPWYDKPKATAKWLQKWLLCISQETAECLDWLPWKSWSKRSGNKQIEKADLYNEAHMKEIKLELIDIQHFLLSAFIELNMDADEIYKLYCEKMQVNHERQEGEY